MLIVYLFIYLFINNVVPEYHNNSSRVNHEFGARTAGKRRSLIMASILQFSPLFSSVERARTHAVPPSLFSQECSRVLY